MRHSYVCKISTNPWKRKRVNRLFGLVCVNLQALATDPNKCRFLDKSNLTTVRPNFFRPSPHVWQPWANLRRRKLVDRWLGLACALATVPSSVSLLDKWKGVCLPAQKTETHSQMCECKCLVRQTGGLDFRVSAKYVESALHKETTFWIFGCGFVLGYSRKVWTTFSFSRYVN